MEGKLVVRNCFNCQSEIKKVYYESNRYFSTQKKYCNQKCYQEYWQKNIMPKMPQMGKDSREIFNCDFCGEKFKEYKSNIQWKHKFCGLDCKNKWMSETFSGEGGPSWNGGITPTINKRCNSKEWAIIRKQVYERDNYTCQICGIKCSGYNRADKIQCDHIIPERLGGDDSLGNLQTLCMRCHRFKDWFVWKQPQEFVYA